MSRPKAKQLCPRRLEIVLEKLDLAMENFEPMSPAWLLLGRCKLQVRSLLDEVTR